MKLIREVKRWPDNLLPYRDDVVRDVILEMKQLLDETSQIIRDRNDITKQLQQLKSLANERASSQSLGNDMDMDSSSGGHVSSLRTSLPTDLGQMLSPAEQKLMKTVRFNMQVVLLLSPNIQS